MIGKYEKPKCECGANLLLVEGFNSYQKRKINADGTESKYAKETGTRDCEALFLECDQCRNKYEIERDEFERLERGEFKC